MPLQTCHFRCSPCTRLRWQLASTSPLILKGSLAPCKGLFGFWDFHLKKTKNKKTKKKKKKKKQKTQDLQLFSFLGRLRTEVKWAGDKSRRATNCLWHASTCPFLGTAEGVGSHLCCAAERSCRPQLPMWLWSPCSQGGGLCSSGPSGPSNWQLQVQQGLLCRGL